MQRRWLFRQRRALGFGVSAMLHVALVGALVWYEVPFPHVQSAFASLDRTIDLEVTWGDEEPTEPAGAAIAVAEPATTESSTLASRPLHEASNVEDLRDFFNGEVPAPTADVKSFVRRGVEQAAEVATTRSDEDLFEQLDRFGNTLNSITNEDRLSRLSARFAGWLNTSDRATSPSDVPAAGRFDIDSAQIHDVLREVGEDGQPQYIAILVDAAGRTERVPLDESEGERLYKTMAIIKKHPMLEAVYRDIVLAFLDKMAGAGSSQL